MHIRKRYAVSFLLAFTFICLLILIVPNIDDDKLQKSTLGFIWKIQLIKALVFCQTKLSLISTSSALIHLPVIGLKKTKILYTFVFRPKLWTWGTIKVSFAQDSSFSWLNLTKRGALFWAPFDTDVSAHKYIIHPTTHTPEIETKCAQIYSVETRICWGPGTDVLTDWLDVRSLHDGPWQWRCASLCLAQRQTGFVLFF